MRGSVGKRRDDLKIPADCVLRPLNANEILLRDQATDKVLVTNTETQTGQLALRSVSTSIARRVGGSRQRLLGWIPLYGR